jgi:hypothetical protein
MTYGGTVPTITASYAGLKNGALAPATPPTCSTMATSTSAVGSYASTCAGAADPNYTFSYVAGSVTVAKAATTIAVTSSANPSVHGQLVTFTATVSRTGTGVVPTGTVQFRYDGVNLGVPQPLSAAGVATAGISGLTTATHSIVAIYSGDTRYLASTSAALSQVVSLAATTTVVTLTSPASRRSTNTYRATVRVVLPGTGTPTGTVRFLMDGRSMGTATLAGGVATLRWRPGTGFAIGNHTVTAVYAGSVNFATSTSAGRVQRLTR